MMNYARAVKGANNRGSNLVLNVQEHAVIELKRTLTGEELALLSSEYSFSDILHNIEKVLT